MTRQIQKTSGFSLVELLIVVVIIGIIAAIAIPNLLASRRAANESSAISTLRSYHGAQATYASTYGNGDFAGVPFVLNAFTALADVGILDSQLGGGVKSGYIFSGHSQPSSGTTPACHLAQAQPSSPSGAFTTGSRAFAIATPGVMHAGGYTGAAGWGPGTCDIAAYLVPLN